MFEREWRQFLWFMLKIKKMHFQIINLCDSHFPVERIKRATINPYNPIASKNTMTIRKRTLQILFVESDTS